MGLDHRVPAFSDVRSALSYVVLPIRFTVDWPVNKLREFTTLLSSQDNLLETNAKLRARQLLLQAKLQRLLAVEKENIQLRNLLGSSYHVQGKVTAAELLAVDLDVFSQQVILNKGAKDHIYVGQPVLDAYGVMGQVVSVSPDTSRVLLITDSRSAVPVQDNRNGLRGIVVGTGSGSDLKMINVPDTADIKVGDVLVSSGLGQRYPVGYPVGVVKSIQHQPGNEFANIVVTPSAHVNRSRQVLLVWPQAEKIKLPLNNSMA